MRVIKYYGNDRESVALMGVFDRVIASTYYNWPLERLEVHVTDSAGKDSWVEGSSGKIFIGKDNNFVSSLDMKGMEAVVLCSLYSLISRLSGSDFRELRERYYSSDPDLFKALMIVEDMMENRRVARKFPDRIFYKRFSEVSSSLSDDRENRAFICSCWLTFSGIDEWSSEYLRDMAAQRVPEAGSHVFIEIARILSSSKDVEKDDFIRIVEAIGKYIKGHSQAN